jgi:undecaprenyl-diphosphatase
VLAILTIVCMAYFDTAFERAADAIEDNPIVVDLSWFATKLGGDGAPLLAILLVVATRTKWKQAALTVFCAFIVQQGSTEFIKYLAGRMRPHEADGLTVFGGPASGYHSFPSGHTSYCFMLAIIAAAYFPRFRWWFYGAALFVGMGRVMADVHFISDILVGAVIGLLSGLLFLRAWPPDVDIFKRPSTDMTPGGAGRQEPRGRIRGD